MCLSKVVNKFFCFGNIKVKTEIITPLLKELDSVSVLRFIVVSNLANHYCVIGIFYQFTVTVVEGQVVCVDCEEECRKKAA